MPTAANPKPRKYKHLIVKDPTHTRVKDKASSNGVTVDKAINIALDICEGKKNEFH